MRVELVLQSTSSITGVRPPAALSTPVVNFISTVGQGWSRIFFDKNSSTTSCLRKKTTFFIIILWTQEIKYSIEDSF